MRRKQENSTPSFARRLLSSLITEELLEEFLGDLEEIFQDRLSARGMWHARFMYWVDALHLVLGFTSFRQLFKNQYKPSVMYRHYFTVARRHLVRNKFHSLVNILSLAVGICVSLLIFQYIHFERSYDDFHGNASNTYRTIFNRSIAGTHQGSSVFNSYNFAETAMAEIPEIKDYLRLYPAEYDAVASNPVNGKTIHVDGTDMYFADKSFLRIFDFPLRQGNASSALDDLYSIVITSTSAKKYFGSTDPLGKTLTVKGGSSPGSYTVTGVLEPLPPNSHLQFEFLMPLDNLWKLGNGGSVNRYGGWARNWFATYFTLTETADPAEVNQKLDQLIVQYKGQVNAKEAIAETVALQRIADIHLRSDLDASADFVANKGSSKDLSFFSIVAFIVLFIAWINYVNLAAAHSLQRTKEIGIRKTIGAVKKQLINQFLLESILVNLVAAFVALGMAYISLPFVSNITGAPLEWNLFRIPAFWLYYTILIITGALLSGLYPAFILSEFKPSVILKTQKFGHSGKISLRSGLITFQFLTSLLLISGTYLVYRQITFMKSQELGLDIEQVLVVKGPHEIPNSPKVLDGTDINQIRAANQFSRTTFQAFKENVSSHPSIAAIAGSYHLPSQVNNISLQSVRKFGTPENEARPGNGVFVGLDFADAYQLEFLAGHSFTEDMEEEAVVIINEEALQTYGLGSPEAALEEKLITDNGPVDIVGVVKNFHWQSLKDPHTPFVLSFVGATPPFISFRVNTSDVSGSLAHIQDTYAAMFPGNPFEYFFMEEAFNRQYQSDLQFGNLFFAFTILAIFIACVGLFALVSFSATARIKEIGIRKILGASVGNLILLLSKEYLTLLLIANVFAIPAIFYFGRLWLNNYAFATQLGMEYYLIPGLILLLISFLTVSSRAYGAARSNPVESLRTE